MKPIKIQTMMIIALILIGLSASVGGSYYFYLNSEKRLIASEHSLLEAVSHSRENHLQSYIQYNLDELRIISSRVQTKTILENYYKDPNNEDLALLHRILSDPVSQIKNYESISILSIDGNILVSSQEGAASFLDVNKLFEEARDKEMISVLPGTDGLPRIILAGPISNDDEFLGVLVIVSDTSGISFITSDTAGLGETGEVYIIDEDYNMITPSRFITEGFYDIVVNTTNSQNCFMHKLLSEEETKRRHQEISLFDDYGGVPVLGTHAYLPETGWCLLAEINYEETIGSGRREIFFNSVWMVSILLIFVIIMALLISRWISVPISRLSSAVEEITKGNFKVDLKQSSIYEIQNLTESLNRILASLKLAVLKVGIKKSDIGLGEALKAKEEAEKRYKDLFDAAVDAILTIDKTGKITNINKAAQKVSGYDFDEIVGHNIATIKLLTLASKLKAVKSFKNRISGIESPPYEIEIIRKDGSIMPAEVNASAIKDNQGIVTGTLAIIRDISDRKKAETQISKKSQDLERFAKLSVGREEKMIDLKKKIKEMEAKLKKK
ncbi:MAG: PAS domain S-box protein [Nanoarchaeota archaeon]|nr:PAS domain S-box protein [Nanoarchaeota archaeon]